MLTPVWNSVYCMHNLDHKADPVGIWKQNLFSGQNRTGKAGHVLLGEHLKHWF